MAKKSLGGAKYFEALGRRCISLNIGALQVGKRRSLWPTWARDAYMRGYLDQMWCIPKGVKTYQFNDPVDIVK